MKKENAEIKKKSKENLKFLPMLHEFSVGRMKYEPSHVKVKNLQKNKEFKTRWLNILVFMVIIAIVFYIILRTLI